MAHLLSALSAIDGATDGAVDGATEGADLGFGPAPCSRSSRACSSPSLLPAESMSPALHTRQRLALEMRPCRGSANDFSNKFGWGLFSPQVVLKHNPAYYTASRSQQQVTMP